MAKTLLAVDDSVTMRKVLEITFSGEDFRVVTADSVQGALGKLSENPEVCVVDTVLGNEDGYALAREIRQRSPQASILMLASRYAPYDQARGREAGADDWADKPFDTQQLIDKIRKVIVAREAGGGASPQPPQQQVGGAPAGMPYRAPAPPQTPPMAAAQAQQPGGLSRGTQPSLGGSVPRAGTLVFGDNPAAHAPPPRPAPGPPPAPGPAPAAPAAQPAPTPAAAAVISTAVNGQLAGKLGGLGLSPEQANAVLALSRDVVERVVWEVVPQLAETMIREEIARLMKE